MFVGERKGTSGEDGPQISSHQPRAKVSPLRNVDSGEPCYEWLSSCHIVGWLLSVICTLLFFSVKNCELLHCIIYCKLWTSHLFVGKGVITTDLYCMFILYAQRYVYMQTMQIINIFYVSSAYIYIFIHNECAYITRVYIYISCIYA